MLQFIHSDMSLSAHLQHVFIPWFDQSSLQWFRTQNSFSSSPYKAIFSTICDTGQSRVRKTKLMALRLRFSEFSESWASALKGLFVHMLTSLFLFSSLCIKAKLHVYEYMDRHFTYLFTFFTLKSRKKQLSASAIRSLKTHSQTQSGVLPSVLGLHPVQRNQSQSWHLNLPSLLQGPGPPLSLSLLCLLFHL